MKSILLSYYSFLIHTLGLKPLTVGIVNTVVVTAFIVVLLLIFFKIVKRNKTYKSDLRTNLIFGFIVLSISIGLQTIATAKLYSLLPDYITFSLNHLKGAWAVIFAVIFVCMVKIHKDSKAVSRKKQSDQRLMAETAEEYGTLLDEVNRGFENSAPLLTFTDKVLSRKELKEMNEVMKKWSFHRESLRVTNEDRGIVLGAPGSGKTTYLISQLVEWMKSGRSFVVTDVKPEIWAILKANNVFKIFGYKDWVHNPTDVQSDHYNLFSEVQDSSELNEVLNIIIKDESAEAVIFNENARRILKAVLIELGRDASLVNAQKFINSMDSNAELIKTLRQSNNSAVSNIASEISRTAQNDRLLASIMTAVSKAFEFLDDDRIRQTTSNNANGFYLKEVLMKPKQAVFLQFDQQYKSSTATLFGATVAHTMRILQANQNRDAVFLALDEIINCAPIPKFTDLLNTIRSANMPTFLYLQSLEGLNRLYGANSDRLFLGSSNLKVIFKIGDIATAKEFSDLIGKTEVTYISKSQTRSRSDGTSSGGIFSSMGSSNSSGKSENSGTTTTVKLEAIIQPEEFIKLPVCTAVVTYNGSFGTLAMPKYYEYYDMPERTKLRTVSEWLSVRN